MTTFAPASQYVAGLPCWPLDIGLLVVEYAGTEVDAMHRALWHPELGWCRMYTSVWVDDHLWMEIYYNYHSFCHFEVLDLEAWPRPPYNPTDQCVIWDLIPTDTNTWMQQYLTPDQYARYRTWMREQMATEPAKRDAT